MPPTKQPQVLAWLAEDRDGSSTTPHLLLPLNAVEGFFSKLTRQSLKRGVLRSVDDLESAIIRYIAGGSSPHKLRLSATTVFHSRSR